MPHRLRRRQSTRCSSTLCRPRKLLITGRKATSSGPSTAASSSAQSPPPKATARKRHAVLRKHHRQVMPAAAQRLGRAGQRHAGGAQQRPGVALAERGQPLDLLHRLERERAQRGLDVDEQLGHPLLGRDLAWPPPRRTRRGSRRTGALRSSVRPPPRGRRGPAGTRRTRPAPRAG